MSETRIKIWDEVNLERQNQEAKWGQQNHKPIEWIAILTEEVGEAAKEALDHHFRNDVKKTLHDYTTFLAANLDDQRKRLRNYRKELIQVAAVAISMIESLERNELNK